MYAHISIINNTTTTTTERQQSVFVMSTPHAKILTQ